MFYWDWSSFSHSGWWTQVRINFYHTSETGEKRNVVIKKEQANLAQLTLVFKVMMNFTDITCIFKICL